MSPFAYKAWVFSTALLPNMCVPEFCFSIDPVWTSVAYMGRANFVALKWKKNWYQHVRDFVTLTF